MLLRRLAPSSSLTSDLHTRAGLSAFRSQDNLYCWHVIPLVYALVHVVMNLAQTLSYEVYTLAYAAFTGTHGCPLCFYPPLLYLSYIFDTVMSMLGEDLTDDPIQPPMALP